VRAGRRTVRAEQRTVRAEQRTVRAEQRTARAGWRTARVGTVEPHKDAIARRVRRRGVSRGMRCGWDC